MEVCRKRQSRPSTLSTFRGCRNVRLILETLYENVESLEVYLSKINPEWSKSGNSLQSKDNAPGFTNLLRRTFVCTEKGAVLPPSGWVHQRQSCHQSEIILMAIERIQRREGAGNNLLTLGYNVLSNNGAAQVCSSNNIEYSYPNQNTSLLLLPAWKTLLTRIGDNVMLHLLESRSIYISIPPSCYVQLTGNPLYLLWPWTGGAVVTPNLPKSHRVGQKKTSYQLMRLKIKRCHQLQRKKMRNKKKTSTREKCSSDGNCASRDTRADTKLSSGQNEAKSTADNTVDQTSLTTISKIDFMPQHEGGSPPLNRRKRKASDALEHQDMKRTKTDEQIGNNYKTQTSSSSGSLCVNHSVTVQDQANQNGICHLDVPFTPGGGKGSRGGVREKLQPHGLRAVPGSSKSDKNCTETRHREEIDGNKGLTSREEKKLKAMEKVKLKEGSGNCKYKFHYPIYKRHMLYSKSPMGFLARSHILSRVKADDNGVRLLLEDIFVKRSISVERWPPDHILGGSGSDIKNKTSGENAARVELKANMETNLKQGVSGNQAAATPPVERQRQLPIVVPGPGRSTGPHQESTAPKLCDEDKTPSNDLALEFLLRSLPALGPLLKKLISNHKRFNYKALLDHSCPVPPVLPVPTVTVNQQNEDIQSTRKPPLPILDAPVYTRRRQVGRCGQPTLGSQSANSAGGQYASPSQNPKSDSSVQMGFTVRSSSRENNLDPNTKVDSQGGPQKFSETADGRYTQNDQFKTTCKSKLDPSTAAKARTGPIQTRPMINVSKHGVQRNNVSDAITARTPSLTHRAPCPAKDAGRRPETRQQQSVGGAVSTRKRKNGDKPGMPPKGVNSSSRCQANTAELLEQHTPSRQVLTWLHQVSEKVVPPDLWGCRQNKKCFMKTVSRYILLGKFEKVTVGNMMTGMKVNSVKWLSLLSNHADRQVALASVLHWMMAYYFLGVLEANFYATDTGTFRNRIFYYRKKVWVEIQRRAIQANVDKGLFLPLDKKEVDEVLRQGALGVGKLRFLPKQSEVRPIINLASGGQTGGAPTGGQKLSLSVNKQLANLFHVLKYFRKAIPTLTGSSMLGLDDIHTALRDMVMKRKQRNDTRPLNLVKVDLAGCYDSINQELLLEIMRAIFTMGSSEFFVRRYARMVLDNNRVKRLLLRDVKPFAEFQPDFLQFVQEQQRQGLVRDAILVDQVVHQVESVDALLEKLAAHIRQTVVKVGTTLYRQVAGISQGSVISSVLCAFYYGRMEERYLPRCHDDDLLMRQVDDFLFVSPDRERALSFLNVMLKGIPEFNCSINKEKTCTNFPCPAVSGIQQLPAKASFPWCGLLLNTSTLEVTVDCARCIGLSPSDTLTFDLGRRPGLSMKDKLLGSLKTKVHAVFVDETINTSQTVIVNLYQLLLIIAYKFIACVRKLPPKQRFTHNVPFFLGMILEMPTAIVLATKRKVQKNRIVFPLSKNQVAWLCVDAFHSVLQTKASLFQPLLVSLRAERRRLAGTLAPDIVEKMREISRRIPDSLGFID